MKTILFTVRISPELRDKLQKMAKEKNLTQRELVQFALYEFMKEPMCCPTCKREY